MPVSSHLTRTFTSSYQLTPVIKLIIITGFPCSGKSYRVQQLLDEFSGRIAVSQPSSRPRAILPISSQHSLSDFVADSPVSLRDRIYNSAAAEKNARAAEFSSVKRALSKDAIIISDSLNYIKGYRYQLWCEAKAAGTRCCVIHVAAREEECKKWNRERLRQHGEKVEAEDVVAVPGVANGREQDAKKPTGFGELIPESHTALYGDREDFEPKSRSSSIDVQLEDEPPAPLLTSFSFRDTKAEAPQSVAPLSLNDNPKIEPQPPSNICVHDAADRFRDRPSANPQVTQPPSSFPTSRPYSPSTLQSLILRYEPPSPFSRWDTPLFTLPSSDPTPPYDAIWSVLFPSAAASRKLVVTKSNLNAPTGATDADEVQPHAATVLPPSTSAQALQLLERTTAEIVSSLLAAYKAQKISDEGIDLTITLPSSPDQTYSEHNDELSVSISIPPGTILTQPMLQRLRRKFTQMQRGGIAHGRGHAVERGRNGVVEAFGRFLEGEFES